MTRVFGLISVVAVAVIGIASVTPRTVHAADATAIATATIITPISITQSEDLDFASIVPVGTAQTVTADTADTVTDRSHPPGWPGRPRRPTPTVPLQAHPRAAADLGDRPPWF